MWLPQRRAEIIEVAPAFFFFLDFFLHCLQYSHMIATCSPTQLPLCSFPRQPFIGFSSQLSLSVRLLSLILFVLHPSKQAARQRQSCKNGKRPSLCFPGYNKYPRQKSAKTLNWGEGGSRRPPIPGWQQGRALCGRPQPPPGSPRSAQPRCPQLCVWSCHFAQSVRKSTKEGNRDEHVRAPPPGEYGLKIEILFFT